MRIARDRSRPAAQADAAWLQAIGGKDFIGQRRHFSVEEAVRLRGERPLETAGGEGIDLSARDAVLLCKRLRRAAHRDVDRGVVERFPEKILEVGLAHAKTRAAR